MENGTPIKKQLDWIYYAHESKVSCLVPVTVNSSCLSYHCLDLLQKSSAPCLMGETWQGLINLLLPP